MTQLVNINNDESQMTQLVKINNDESQLKWKLFPHFV